MAIENDMLALARTDVELSDLILGTTNDELKQNAAAYHTEQAVEKTIKHLLIQKRGYSFMIIPFIFIIYISYI